MPTILPGAVDPLRAPDFTLQALANALGCEPPTDIAPLRIVATEQMLSIACAVWRYASGEGLDTPVMGAQPPVTLRELAEALSDQLALACQDRVTRDAPEGRYGLKGGRYVLFGAGEAQMAVVRTALTRAAERV